MSECYKIVVAVWNGANKYWDITEIPIGFFNVGKMIVITSNGISVTFQRTATNKIVLTSSNGTLYAYISGFTQ